MDVLINAMINDNQNGNKKHKEKRNGELHLSTAECDVKFINDSAVNHKMSNN